MLSCFHFFFDFNDILLLCIIIYQYIWTHISQCCEILSYFHADSHVVLRYTDESITFEYNDYFVVVSLLNALFHESFGFWNEIYL